MRADSGGGGADSVFVPPQGSPGAIRAAADHLNRVAVKTGDLGSDIRRNRIDDDAWSDSIAADAYSRRTDSLEGLSGHIETPLSRMSQAIHSYASILDSTQRKVIEAKERYDRETAASVEPITTVNANPHRTQAQVDSAESESAKHASAAETARDDAVAAQDAYTVETAGIAQTIADIASELAHGTRLQTLAQETVGATEADLAEGGEPGEEEEPWWLELNKMGKITLDTKDFMVTGLGLLAGAANYGMFKDVDKMTKAERAAWRDAKATWEKGIELFEGGNWKESPKEWFKKGPWGRLLDTESENALKAAAKSGEEAGEVAKGLKFASYGLDALGKIVGPVGILAGGVETREDAKHHHWAEMEIDAQSTAAAAGATFAPPPADAICAAAGLGLIGEKALYHHVPVFRRFSDWRADTAHAGYEVWRHHPGTAAKDLGKGVSRAWHHFF